MMFDYRLITIDNVIDISVDVGILISSGAIIMLPARMAKYAIAKTIKHFVKRNKNV